MVQEHLFLEIIPYSNAVPDNASLESPDPTIDLQTDIYNNLQTLLDGAISKINNATTNVGSEDIYFSGNVLPGLPLHTL